MSITYKRSGKHIDFTILYAGTGQTAFLEIISDRNHSISRMSDVSLADPNPIPGNQRYPQDVDNWYPVVDIQTEPRIYAKVWLDETYNQPLYFNSYMNPQPFIPDEDHSVSIDAKWLVDWENGLYLLSKTAKVEKFAIIKEIPMLPTISRKMHISIDTITEDWGGTINAY